MEVKLVVTLVAWLLLCISNRGNAGCSFRDLKVNETTVPGQTGQYPVHWVTVENKCTCVQIDIRLACPGFNRSIYVEPPGTIVVAADEDNSTCVFIDGKPLIHQDVIKFKYEWSTTFSLTPLSSYIFSDCTAA